MKPSPPYHGTLEIFGLNHWQNSTGMRDEKVLAKRERKAEALSRRILKLLMSTPYTSFTPPAVAHLLNAYIGSVRPRMTTLTKFGYLVKLDEQREGIFGVENHTWQWSGKTPPENGPLWPTLKRTTK